MEMCIEKKAKKSKKSKNETAESSMQQQPQQQQSNKDNNYQKICHQNQTKTQGKQTHKSKISSYCSNNYNNNQRDRDHLKKQHENQRTKPKTKATSSNGCSDANRSCVVVSSSIIKSSKASSNVSSHTINNNNNCCTQLNTLYLLLVLLIVGLAHHSATASPYESRRDALLAYYKRAHLQQQSAARGAVAVAASFTYAGGPSQSLEEYHLHDASAVDFDELTPTVSVVSALSRAERLRKRSPIPTTPSTASTTVTATAAEGAAITTARAAAEAASSSSKKPEEKCDPKVLEMVPDEPFYDFTDIAEDAARQFIEFLSNKFPNANTPIAIDESTRAEVSRRANSIASYALNEDENLLAFAIAAPSIHTVVVKFRDNVTIPPDQVHNKAFLGSYWRELGAAWNSSDGTQEWGAPFRDCNLLKRRWLWPFRISFTEHRIKIVAAAFIAADEDVCNDGLEEVFGRRHGCDRNTTFCLLTENKPAATRDVYTCLCRESFYLPNSTLQGFRGDVVELSEGYDNYSCIPCPGGCTNCDQHGVCLNFQEEEALNMDACLRLLVAIVLGACILCCVVLGVIVFRQRKSKAIASGMWTVLETILLGIVLLYASVAVHFFPASTERCLLEPWLRELGFITCYGAIILKLYRHLVDFRTRKAHRWVLRDVDLLKYLGAMVFAVVCYMSAFTASSLDLLESAQLESLREASTNTCHPLKWELVTQTSEILILCFGLHLSIASRNANTQFRERQFLVTALTLEFLVSSSFYFLRFVYLPEMSPSAILLALFVRSQLTNSFALGLIFVPKLWYQHKQVRSLAYDLSIRLPVDAFKGASHDAGQRLGGGYAGLCLGDPDIGELTISEMSPEDIRAELKRLYTQLEILKNKTLRQDNPHISKRRGGRKAGHRRFSLQKKGSKDKALSAKHRSNKHHQDIEITEAEPSRTPEDSVCSAEGPTDTYAEISGVSHSMLSHSMVSHSIVSHSK
ncbi:probable G-protein coupled receptor 179 isoform X1 [Drosophila guanche]|uniref:Blast:Probable G-protein coupled receptor 179 n=1 Tax=Drosophila guanche TaxID=7266 RepID=A0A3B0K2B0_DROGU|nr:probable G-protein coupled receptor 179 isoform X1 [Drosophila guanche]SPP79141.1 blast:Probable G-protein coupled receptor 179 [Drosophila guanche]